MSQTHERPIRPVIIVGGTRAGLAAVGLGADVLPRSSGLGWLVLGSLSAGLVVWAVLLGLVLRLASAAARRDQAYSGLFESHPQPILLVDADSLDIVAVNAAGRERYGYSPEEFAALTVLDLHRPHGREDSPSDWVEMDDAARRSLPGVTHMAKDGTTFTVELASRSFERAGRRLWMTVVTDVTERDDARADARQADSRYRQMTATATEAILTVDLDMAISEANQVAADLLGYSAQDLVGRPISEFYGPGGADAAAAEAAQRADGRLIGEREMTLRDKDGVLVPVLVNESPLLDRKGDYAGQLGMITDLTERKGFEDELSFRARHDPLTGLANRLLLADRLSLALGRARGQSPGVAVVFIDIDEFKILNTSYGHTAGDALLVEVGSRLSAAVAERDTVARFGANEFVVVSEGSGPFAQKLVEALSAVLDAPFEWGDVQLDFTVGMGVATGGNAERPGTLLRNADTALMQAKANGKARTEFFTDALGVTSRRRLAIASELRRAVDRGEFSLAFQPLVALADGHILGGEVLLRWEHPRRGRLAPSEFISVAEETGLIVPIGKWVIEESTRRLAGWQPLMADLSVSINISARQLSAGGLEDILAGAIAASGVDAGHLVLEITESVLMDDVERSCDVLSVLRATGVSIAIDDFGTGYSSLSYLNRFPVDILKIDQSFVAGLPEDAYDTALVQAVLALAEALDLSPIAEGVENQAQADTLLSLGCQEAQGFHFYRPLTPEAFEAVVVADRGRSR